jgi:hypothetical protein
MSGRGEVAKLPYGGSKVRVARRNVRKIKIFILEVRRRVRGSGRIAIGQRMRYFR